MDSGVCGESQASALTTQCADDGPNAIGSPQPGQPKRVAFKYYINQRNIECFWIEVNCVIRIPKHPNIVSFDRLVTDTIGDEEKVVGFTTAFVSGGTVDDNLDRLFKLKYLKQLTEAIDHLNLKLGVVHSDLCIHNLLINEETDSLQIFDFNSSFRLGDDDSDDPERRDDCDVRYAVFALYDIISRDFGDRFEGRYLPDLDPAEVLEMQTWKKHPRVRLDSDVTEYRRVLEAWVKDRRDSNTDNKKITQAIRWPPMPEITPVEYLGGMESRSSRLRQVLVPRGEPFLRWERPPSRHLPLHQGQRLLATGEVVGLQRGERRRG
ncbi:hypothetical protein QBC46DRAFT_418712 [Diplogelasinospora grovesii]|uniref:EKC/KEOPS complex subunit BUD32 n=1 Tax=Diplogelasinospora grovesii TaxID=303347 RepID=A0AAN6N1P0_9PEZI|nr:hypothetical protein QBC46DRAFT_418712 [Diplogelasinospora grovesii]